MGFETRLVLSKDDARRLIDLVYSCYGLTYHRSFLYEPEQLLDLQRRGHLRSLAGVDSSTGEVIAHIATIRPWWEAVPDEIAARPPTAVEIGLSIVHPDHRGHHLQTAMGIAALQAERAANPSLRSMFAKCLTVHTASQASARSMYGRASALLLGSVPSWVVHETGEQRAPMTTVVLHSPCVEGERAMWVPEGREALFTRLLADSPLRRRLMPARRGRLRGATRLTCSFEPARRRGVVRVWRPGADLVDAVSSKVGWMLKGSMEHVTVLLPLRREVAARAGELEARGLFFGGFVPDLDGEDTLVLQALSRNLLDASTIAVQGDEAELLRDEVLRGWGRAMRSRAADDSGRSAGA